MIYESVNVPSPFNIATRLLVTVLEYIIGQCNHFDVNQVTQRHITLQLLLGLR